MKAPTIEELKAQFTELGYKWPTIHIVGIRSKANEPNKFDDLNNTMADLLRILKC